MRKCSRCLQGKLFVEFSSERGRPRGVCRTCRNEQENNRAHVRSLRDAISIPTSKECSRCLEVKPSSEFSLRTGRADGLQAKCKRCCALIQRAHKYGITPEWYEAKEIEQAGCCAICERIPAGGVASLRVDHDHETSRVRGLICHSCNAAIGQLGDDPEMLIRAASYLLEYVNVLAIKEIG